MDNYVSTGKVYLIHRDFPLPMHAHSQVAAQYSRAAAQIANLNLSNRLCSITRKVGEDRRCRWHRAAILSPAEMTKVRALVKAAP